MKNKEQQIELIEEAFKQAHQAQPTLEVPEGWQGSVMAAIKREAKAEDAVVVRTETIMFRLSWIAAGIAAILVLIFGLFFYPNTEKRTLEDDFRNLYVDTVNNDLLTMNSQ